MIVRPDNKLFQVLADTRGRHAIFINGRISELEGVITHSSYHFSGLGDLGLPVVVAAVIGWLLILRK